MKPVVCDSCDAQFLAGELPYDDAFILEMWCHLQEFLKEREALHEVQHYFQRYPEAECILPRIDALPHITEKDREVVQYLQKHHFSLKPRLAFVEERVGKLNQELSLVACPACRSGKLAVHKDFQQSYFAGEETTSYKLHTMRQQENGTIWMRASGYRGQEQWTGQYTVGPQKTDYTFWLWLLSHRESYPVAIDDEQLASIKEEWLKSVG